MTTIGSLFSGIGGLELGLEMAGLGPVLWQVERSPYCRAVLERHWPDARRYDDVRTVGAGLAPVDLICGGFPCQDVSSAGARAGLAGERSGLWREFARVITELRPAWVVVENVASGAGLWLDAVVRELGELGYDTLPIPLSAEDVGAPHRRARVFVVAAHADRISLRQQREREPGGWSREIRAQGDSEPPHTGEARDVGHADGSERARPQPAGGERRWRRPTQPAWRSPMPDFLRVADGVRGRLDSPRRRIAALGNSVVPQCAEVVGWVIRELAAT